MTALLSGTKETTKDARILTYFYPNFSVTITANVFFNKTISPVYSLPKAVESC